MTAITALLCLAGILQGGEMVSDGNRTTTFLGPPADWNRATVELLDVHALFGGRNVLVTGDGRVRVQVVEPGGTRLTELRYAADYPPASADPDGPVRELFDALVNGDFVTVPSEERTALPDEALRQIVLVNPRGDSHVVEAWEGCTLGPDAYAGSDRQRFDRVFTRLRWFEADQKENGRPAFRGPYEAGGWSAFRKTRPPAAPPPEATLTGEGRIHLSGGCEVYAEGELRFLPSPSGVRVSLRNLSPHPPFLGDADEPIGEFTTTLGPTQAGAFFEKVRALLAAPGPSPGDSTREARVSVRLPLSCGMTLADWKEDEAGPDLDPLLDLIDDFVRACARRPDGSGTPSSPP